ncbi:MAG TPA: ATP-dependent DNA ligase [Candidatus Diapherotrites archaeon]|mgnify:FL=1|jgi:DNA ligase-1|nr:ATP-dependent DNA ligase [Candidatus Diapherotrites archaeon]
MEFKVITEYFEKIDKTSSRLEMASILSDLFLKTPAKDISNLIYFCQGTLGPKYKSVSINLGEATIISCISEYLGLPENKIKEEYLKLGDLGVVFETLQSTKSQRTLFSKALEFDEVYNTLLKIAQTNGKDAVSNKLKYFKFLLYNLDKVSAKYIIRFPIAYRLGFGDSTIIDALAFLEANKLNLPDEEKKEKQKEFNEIITSKYNIASDLGLIGKVIKDKGIDGVKLLSLIPFIPFKSQLCERAKSFEEIKERLGDRFLVDTKIDGFRQQIHKFGNEIKIFSRNEEDITHMFPDIIKAIKRIPKDFIIDCEAVAYDEKHDKYFSFQMTIQRKRKYGIIEFSKNLPLHLNVFDILYYDKKEVYLEPFEKRRELVVNYFNYPPLIMPTNAIIVTDIVQLKDFFNKCISKGLEGIIAKDLNASYKAGVRGFHWIKYKKSFGEDIDTIDACIVGGFYGKGKRSEKGIGALLMAIYNPDNDTYSTIAKLGTGLSDEMLEDLSKKLNDLKLTKKPKDLITNIEPDFYVIPKIVVEINFDEITESPIHTCCYDKLKQKGLALRFPRLIKFRDDKSEKETTSEEEIKRMFLLQKNS